MNKYVVTAELDSVLANEIRIPTIVMWNRLEGRPRRPDFTRALKAEVRDPLWMITRQWQMGEFIGEDAGSPVSAKVAWTHRQGHRTAHARQARVPYDPDLPLEAVIEARPVAADHREHLHNADLRLALGRRWKRAAASRIGHGARVRTFLGRVHVHRAEPAAKPTSRSRRTRRHGRRIAAVAGRAIDGGALLLHLTGGGAASDGLGLVGPQKTHDRRTGRGVPGLGETAGTTSRTRQ